MSRKVRSNPRNSKKSFKSKRSKLRKNTRKKSRAHTPVQRRRTNIYRRGSQKGGAGFESIPNSVGPVDAAVMVALLASAYATSMGMQAAWRAAWAAYRRVYPLPLSPEQAARRLFGTEDVDVVAPAVAPPVADTGFRDQAAINQSWTDHAHGYCP